MTICQLCGGRMRTWDAETPSICTNCGNQPLIPALRILPAIDIPLDREVTPDRPTA